MTIIKTTLTIILFCLTTLGFSQNSFEFHGKVSIDGVSPQAVKISITKDGRPYKSFHPESNGKYSFNLDYNSVYIVSYNKKGFVNKKVEINTNVPEKVLKDNKFKYKWKTDVYLFKKYEGIDFSFFDEPIQKIFFNDKTRRFIYDDKYAKQIEKELREKMAEVEKRKAEERKKAEQERLRLAKERQQAIKDSLANIRAQKKLKEQQYKQQQLARQKAIQDSLKNAKILAQQQAEEQRKIKEQELKQKIEEQKKQREEQKKILAQQRAERQKQLKEEAERKRAEKERRMKEYIEAQKQKRQQMLEMMKKNITTTTEENLHEKITKVTVTQGKITNYYRKVVWDWGGVFYFRNNHSISRAVYYLETKE